MFAIDAHQKITAVLYDEMTKETVERPMEVSEFLNSHTRDGCPLVVEVVPLEQLCGYLANIYVPPYRTENTIRIFNPMDIGGRKEMWEYELRRLMNMKGE